MTSTSETTAIDTSLDDVLNEHFAGRVVRKDLTKLVKEGANVPVYVLEYLLGNYCASNEPAVIEDGLNTVKRVLAENYVRPDEAEKVKSTIRERGSLKVIDKVTVKLNEKWDVYRLARFKALVEGWRPEHWNHSLSQELQKLLKMPDVAELLAEALMNGEGKRASRLVSLSQLTSLLGLPINPPAPQEHPAGLDLTAYPAALHPLLEELSHWDLNAPRAAG